MAGPYPTAEEARVVGEMVTGSKRLADGSPDPFSQNERRNLRVVPASSLHEYGWSEADVLETLELMGIGQQGFRHD
jgi:hypothetical protein